MIKVLAEFCRFILHKNLKGETMVDGINQPKPATQHSVLKLKGKDGQTIDLNKLKGLKETKENEALFKKYDSNGDHIIDEKEALAMRNNLQSIAGNRTISKREIGKHFGKEAFEALSSLAEQQKAQKQEAGQTEKSADGYTSVKNQDGSITYILDDGSKETRFPDGKKVYTKPDGSTITHTSDGNKTIMHDSNGNITSTIELTKDGREIRTEYETDGNKTIARAYDGTGKDAPLDSITVSEKQNGHNIDTKYASEEDMKNGRPSEQIRDAQNPTLKTITKFTYDDKGNIKAETTDSAGKQTIKYTDANGKEIASEQFDIPEGVNGGELPEVLVEAKAPTEEAKQLRQQLAQMYGDSFEVGYAKDGTIEIRNPDGSINENLTAQANNQLKDNTLLAGAINGGELPEVVVEAKAPTEEAKQLRQQLAQMYGDSFEVGYAKDGTIEIRNPDGSINENLTAQANNQLNNNTLLAGAIDGGVLPEVVIEAKAPTQEAKELRQQLAQILGDNYEVGYAKDGTLEIRNTDGSVNENLTADANVMLDKEPLREQLAQVLGDNYDVEIAQDGNFIIRDKKTGEILKEATENANDMNATTDQEDIETIMVGSDVINKDGHIDKKEYNNFINSMLESAGFEITDNNREQIQKMIENSFTSLDSINADGKVTMEELQANAKEVIQKLTDDLLAATDISENPEEPV